MEKQPNDKGLFEDDDLDQAIANVDDTGMVKTAQQIVVGQEIEHLEQPEEEPPA